MRSERKRLHLHRKLVIYFLLLAALILGILWLFQIGMFNEFYRSITTKRIDLLSDRLKEKSADEFEDFIEEIGDSDNICTVVYKINYRTLSPVADYHTEKSCFVHSISDGDILTLYRLAAIQDDGRYRVFLSSEEIDKYFPDKNVIVIDGAFISGTMEHYRQSSGQSSDSMLSVFLFQSHGESYFAMMSTMVIPINATTQTLTFQLSAVTVIALLLSLALSLILARKLAKPLGKLNQNARKLPSGDFERMGIGGCREIQELENTLDQASDKIRKADDLRKELIANVSHDLRTPLTLILAYSEMMQDLPGEISPENLQVIIDETARLTRLVNDMLDISKLESGMQTLDLSVFNITKLTSRIVDRIRAMTENQGYKLIFQGEGDREIEGDEVKLSQVIYNLVTNAVNYTGEDKTVYVRQTFMGDLVRLEVIDSGEGIPPEQLDLIWDRYYKAPGSRKKEQVGTGLGLSIAKKILQMHGFHFGVNSRPGVGSCFWFEAPLFPEGEEKIR